MNELIQRARNCLAVMSELDAAQYLMDVGFDSGEVFLAVKAAVLLEADLPENQPNRPGMTFRDPEAMAQIKLEAEYDERHCRD